MKTLSDLSTGLLEARCRVADLIADPARAAELQRAQKLLVDAEIAFARAQREPINELYREAGRAVEAARFPALLTAQELVAMVECELRDQAAPETARHL